MQFHYTAYGLNYRSDLRLPELLPVANCPDDGGQRLAIPDISIRVGQTPAELADPTGDGVLYQASADQFLLKLDDVARYLVQNGNELIVEPAPGALESDIRVFLLGSCFAALLHQRGLLVLHASAIRTETGAVLFCGPSGIGKSTLLGELLNRGYPMMVDDVCAVVVDEAGLPMVLPGYPRTRLWANFARKLAVETEGLERTRPSLEKYERQVPDLFWDQPAPLRHIYHLTSSNKEELSLEPLPAIPTFSAVLHNTYRKTFLDGLEMRQPHFKLVSAVATTVGVTRIVRPSGVFVLAELADLLEDNLQH